MAHPNQMPLKRVTLDKGDGTIIGSEMAEWGFANRRPVCAANNCGSGREMFSCANDNDCSTAVAKGNCVKITDLALQFGFTSDTGCKSSPYSFSLDYNCPLTVLSRGCIIRALERGKWELKSL